MQGGSYGLWREAYIIDPSLKDIERRRNQSAHLLKFHASPFVIYSDLVGLVRNQSAHLLIFLATRFGMRCLAVTPVRTAHQLHASTCMLLHDAFIFFPCMHASNHTSGGRYTAY